MGLIALRGSYYYYSYSRNSYYGVSLDMAIVLSEGVAEVP